MVILFALITTVRQLLPFLGYIKAEESSGVNTEGGLSGPELEMLKAGGMNVTIVLLLFTLQILSFDALQCVGQPYCYTWFPSSTSSLSRKPPSNQMWKSL